MNVCLDEHRLGALRWIVLRGPDREAFRALGERTRTQISALAEEWPLLPRLRAHVCGPPGRDRLAAVRRASAERSERSGPSWPRSPRGRGAAR